MPVKNAELFLHQTIDSIINQSLTDWELIAIDDFSDDDSFGMLKEYALLDSRIQVFKNIEKGIVPALDLAYSLSKGDFITRMDADDMMSKAKLEWMLNSLKDTNHLSVCTGLVKYFSDNGLKEGYIKYEKWLNSLIMDNRFLQERFKECVIPSPSWMMSRKGLEKIGGICSGDYPEDYELCLRMLEHKVNMVVVPEVLHHWRDHSSRASRNDPHYSDNLFSDIKIQYFIKELKREGRTTLLYGAGRKAKQIAKKLIALKVPFEWVSSNEKKIGHNIYGQIIKSIDQIESDTNYKIIVAISGPDDQNQIRIDFNRLSLYEGVDYYFFC
jgi:glycosyltransferase involved in cell wall biosynthesis